MKERTFEEARHIIKNLDEKTLDERSLRLKELGVIQYSSFERSTSSRMSDYSVESGKSYVEGCFRSCIFCCAAAIDQAFRHEIIRESNTPKKERKNLKGTFGPIIKQAKDTERLQPFLEDATWLNGLRNTVAVHPLCFWPFPGEEIMEIKIIIEDLKKIITVAGAEYSEQIKQLFIIREDGSKVVLADVLCDPTKPEASDLLMWRLDNDILKPLALKAYQRMAGIIEGLYPSAQR
jgi:hypothetical protein